MCIMLCLCALMLIFLVWFWSELLCYADLVRPFNLILFYNLSLSDKHLKMLPCYECLLSHYEFVQIFIKNLSIHYLCTLGTFQCLHLISCCWRVIVFQLQIQHFVFFGDQLSFLFKILSQI